MKRITFLFAILLLTTTAWCQGGPTTKSFSWHGLSLNYPDNYVISDKKYDKQDKTFDFYCSIPEDDGEVSLVYIGMLGKMSGHPTKSECDEFFQELMPPLIEELGNSFQNVKTGEVKEFPIAYPNSSVDFTGSSNTTDIQGTMVIIIEKKKIVFCLLAADSDPHLQELNKIVKSIKVK
ncbi:MAG: hypothetical protein IKU03_05595 [Bacteroidales bacterium]|nr:hypothetical protein [Bacteroidales bacterium]